MPSYEQFEKELHSLLSSYINTIDTMRKAATSHGIFGASAGNLQRINEMNAAINNHANQLGQILPSLNLAELTAMSDLLSSRLAQVRMVRDFKAR
jgi:hypothetical protein